jgi:hypothetical protein
MLTFAVLPLLTSQISGATSIAADRMWLCEGLEDRQCPVRVMPGPKLRIVSSSANVVCDKESVLELQPEAVGVSPSDECVLVEGAKRLAAGFGTTKQPVPALELALIRPQFSAQLFAVSGRTSRRIGKYEFRMDPSAPSVGLQLKDGWIAPAAYVSEMYVFSGQEQLGYSKSGAFRIDSRRLAPGYYEFWTVPILKGGEIGPLRKSEIWIESRWRIGVQKGTIVAEGKSSTQVEVQGAAGPTPSPVVETWVYVDGAKTATIQGAVGRIDLDTSNLSSGKHDVTLVGRCQDDRLLAPESTTIEVRNPFIDAEVKRNSRLGELERKMAAARRLDQTIAELYERAIRSPDVVRVSRTTVLLTVSEFRASCSVALIDRWEPSDSPSRLFGACRRAVVEQAALRVDIAKLLVRLGRQTEARTWLSEGIRQAGESSATGTEARSILSSLR